MQDAILVRKRERVGDAAGNVGALIAGERAAFNAHEQVRQGEAVNELHHEVGPARVVLKVVDRDDVGMREQACGSRLGKGLRNG